MMKANKSMMYGEEHMVPHHYDSSCDVSPVCVEEEEVSLLDSELVRDTIISHYGANYGANRRDNLLVALGLEPVKPRKKTYRVVFEYTATEKNTTLKSLGLPDNSYIISHEETK